MREAPGVLTFDDLVNKSATAIVRRGIPIRGRVLDPMGRPLVGAAVRQGWGFVCGPHERTLTDSAGRFCFRNSRSGRLALTVQTPGFSHQSHVVTVHQGLGEITFVLARGRPLRGHVTTDQGQPIAGARLVASGTPPECDAELTTDAHGEFNWHSAPSTPLEFTVVAPGFLSRSHVWLKPDDAGQVVALHREPRVSGTVVDARTGRPIPSFNVLTSITAFPDGSARFTWAAIGRQGQFSVPIQQLHRVYEVGNSTGGSMDGVRVRIEASGYRPAASQVLFPLKGASHADFALLEAHNP
jgi:hypothetical protein